MGDFAKFKHGFFDYRYTTSIISKYGTIYRYRMSRWIREMNPGRTH